MPAPSFPFLLRETEHLGSGSSSLDLVHLPVSCALFACLLGPGTGDRTTTERRGGGNSSGILHLLPRGGASESLPRRFGGSFAAAPSSVVGLCAVVASCRVWSLHLGPWGLVVKQSASSMLSTSARFVAGAIVFVRLLFPGFCLLVACVCGLLGYSEVLVRRGSGLWVWLASLWLCVLEPRSTAQNGWRCCFTY